MPGAAGTGNYSVIVSNGYCTDTSSQRFVEVLGIDKAIAAGLNVYPNPASELLNIQGNIAAGAELKMINASGQIVYSAKISTETTLFEMRTAELPRGLYILHVTSAGSKSITKVSLR